MAEERTIRAISEQLYARLPRRRLSPHVGCRRRLGGAPPEHRRIAPIPERTAARHAPGMTRLPLKARSAGICVLVIVASGGFAASGCSDDTETSGLEKLSPAQVQKEAAAALQSAKSAHVTGTGVVGNRTQIDLRINGTSTSGTFTAEGVRIAITRIGDNFYIKADRRGLTTLGASAAVRRVGANRWLKLGIEQITEWKGFSLGDFAGQLTEDERPFEPGVAQAEINGKPAVVVSHRDGSKLYVANTGPAYPLRGDYKGPSGARLEFTEYGTDFSITAPENAVDISNLTDRG
jgi:hypothetical protein